MCLNLTDNSKLKTAKKDIVVYKHVNVDTFKDGDNFTGIINGIECSGEIKIYDDNTYFCTNDVRLDGATCPTRKTAYSWFFDSNVTSVVVDGVDLLDANYILKLTEFITPYRKAKVKIGETYTSVLVRDRNDVEAGLHSFNSKKDAVNETIYNRRTAIVECIIPKGSKYYVGSYSGYVSYASDKLKYVKVVEKYN